MALIALRHVSHCSWATQRATTSHGLVREALVDVLAPARIIIAIPTIHTTCAKPTGAALPLPDAELCSD